jgi:hypothetical protein
MITAVIRESPFSNMYGAVEFCSLCDMVERAPHKDMG